MRERIQTFGELAEMDKAGEWAYFGTEPVYEAAKLIPKGSEKEATKTRLNEVYRLVDGVSEANWHDAGIKDSVWEYAEKEGRGNVLWPLRFALSGKEKSPDPFSIAGIIGKDATKKRIKQAIENIGS
jgi:glutamyl/glutaminyl-tRNA synthetase